jgi:apolipoprotein N-acyltransferase
MIYSQMQNVAKVRAVENDRWFVQSANMSPAFVLDNHGEVIAESEWNIPSVLQVPVAPRLNQTLYTKIGEGFVALLVVVVGMLFASSYFYKNR